MKIQKEVGWLMLNERSKMLTRYHRRLPFRIVKRVLGAFHHPRASISYLTEKLVIRNSSMFDEAYYLAENPELTLTWANLLRHFILFGWREGRNPSAKFSTTYYIRRYPDVLASGQNPFFHYLRNGRSEGRFGTQLDEDIHTLRQSRLFDDDYYLQNNPDVAEAGCDALVHFASQGWKEGRNPSAGLSVRYYLAANPDVRDANMNPLLHYVLTGHREGRPFSPRQVGAHDTIVPVRPIVDESDASFEPKLSYDLRGVDLDVRLITFYLPQFHPIPENDAWWGRGFTEWTNVTCAKPLFPGHYHPHLPLEGFYDLRIKENIVRHVELAQMSGVRGFCFYHYWFNGRRLLEKPVDLFLEDRTIEMPFCLCWANENWTRRWDGEDQDILISQEHSPEDDIEFIKNAERYLRDDRYITVDGKKLLIVYRPGLLPDPPATISRWRSYCSEHDLGEIYLAMVQGFGELDPTKFGFDAAIEFPINEDGQTIINHSVSLPYEFTGRVYDITELQRITAAKMTPSYQLFRTVIPSWDNTPRKNTRGTIYLNGTPAFYERWLAQAVKQTKLNPTPSKRLMFVNAWNEWGEGNHLELDRRFGYAFLNATARVLLRNASRSIDERVLFVSNNMCLGGAQVVLLSYMQWMSQYHTRTRMVLLTDAPGKMSESFENICTVVYAQAYDLRESLLEKLSEAAEGSFVYIYANSVASSGFFPVLELLSAPIITHIHELERSIRVYGGKHAYRVFDLSRGFIACSGPVAENLIANHEVSEERIATQHAFISAEIRDAPTNNKKETARKSLGLPLSGKIVLCVGIGLYWRKGADLFVDTALEFCEIHPDTDVTFVWVGDFDRSGYDSFKPWSVHEEKLSNPLLKERIRFFPTAYDIRSYLEAVDLFYLPSREDPFPLVCLEAAEYSLPIVCFEDAGGMPQFVELGAGRVVPYCDIGLATKAIYEILHDDQLRSTFGKQANALVLKRYTVDVIAPRIYSYCHSFHAHRPKVSVIIPNYNYGRYLPQRIDSVLNQTFQDFEIIILDDASTDESMEVILRYSQLRNIQVARNTVNSGSVFLQWQRGIDLARGEIVWIAEADDFGHPRFLECLVPQFDDSRVGLAYCSSHVVDEVGNVAENFYKECAFYSGLRVQSKWRSDYKNDGKTEMLDGLALKNTIPNVSAVLMRAASLRDVPFNEVVELRTGGDWYVYLSILQKSWLSYCKETLNYHRRHPASVLGRASTHPAELLEDYFRIHKKALSDFDIEQLRDDLFAIADEIAGRFPELSGKDLTKYYDKRELLEL